MLYYKEGSIPTRTTIPKKHGKIHEDSYGQTAGEQFFAFRNTLDRFIYSYEQFIKEFDGGNVYVSKKHSNKVFEFLENDDDEAVQRLIDEGKGGKV